MKPGNTEVQSKANIDHRPSAGGIRTEDDEDEGGSSAVGLKARLSGAEQSHSGFAGSDPQLVDGRLGDVGSLLGVVQLMLDLSEAHGGAAHLLLLVDR